MATIVTRGIKTTIRMRKKTLAIVITAALVGKKTVTIIKTEGIMKTVAMTETTIIVKTMAIVVKAFKIFRKRVIITMEKKTATMVSRTSRKNSAIKFDKKKILI